MGTSRGAAARAAGVEFVDADVTQIYARPCWRSDKLLQPRRR